MNGLKDILALLGDGKKKADDSSFDLGALIREVGRRERLSQFTTQDRFTRFADEAPFVKRALQMAKEGRKGIDGKSVFTRSHEIDDEQGNATLVIVPQIQTNKDGSLLDLSGKPEALQRALENKNVLRIPIGNRSDPDFSEKLQETRRVASEWAGGFSGFLGKQK